MYDKQKLTITIIITKCNLIMLTFVWLEKTHKPVRNCINFLKGLVRLKSCKQI